MTVIGFIVLDFDGHESPNPLGIYGTKAAAMERIAQEAKTHGVDTLYDGEAATWDHGLHWLHILEAPMFPAVVPIDAEKAPTQGSHTEA